MRYFIVLMFVLGCDDDKAVEDPGDNLADVPSDGLSLGAQRVIYVGDSIAFETSPVVKYVAVSRGFSYAASTKGGMAICDFFPETEEGAGTFRTWSEPVPPNLYDLVAFMKPQVVVMQFWGNSWIYTPCMKVGGEPLAPGSAAYYDRYAADAERAMEIIESAADAGGFAAPKVLWVLQGPDKGKPDRPRVLNASYTALAETWPNAGTIDAGREVSMAAYYYDPGDRYGWTEWLPCTQYERDTNHCKDAYGGVAQIHKSDDTIHFCLGKTDANGLCDVWSPGIQRYGLAIAAAIERELE